jgi:hypothetical protein
VIGGRGEFLEVKTLAGLYLIRRDLEFLLYVDQDRCSGGGTDPAFHHRNRSLLAAGQQDDPAQGPGSGDRISRGGGFTQKLAS